MRLILSLALAFGALATMGTADDAKKGDHEHECALDFRMKSIDGKKVDLEDYEGNVVLIVNTASQCGLTNHYAGLQDLYAKYKEKGFVVLGFPCNQFGAQEPGTEAEIAKFCSTEYNVTFPMFAKIDVNGADAAPLYKNLTKQDVKPAGKGNVKWNFEKFLIDREGNVVGRFAPATSPDDTGLVTAIEGELKKKG